MTKMPKIRVSKPGSILTDMDIEQIRMVIRDELFNLLFDIKCPNDEVPEERDWDKLLKSRLE